MTRHDRHQKEIDKVKDKIDNLQGDNDKAAGPSGANKGPRGGKGDEKKPLPQRGTGNVRQLAPGIKVFTEPAWQYFTHRELDLVRDFNYRYVDWVYYYIHWVYHYVYCNVQQGKKVCTNNCFPIVIIA